jgi:hypothetical protein
VVSGELAKERKTHDRFKDIDRKEKPGVNFVEEDSGSDSEIEVCVTKWIDTPKEKPLVCSFLRPSPGKEDEAKYTFDVTKCDKLFDVLLQNKVIRLSEGHTLPTLDQLPKGKYCKWHGTFSHNTNECNYFCWQVQSALNDGQLTLGSGHKMKLDTDPFPTNVNMINFEEKRVIVHTSQADTTRGKNIIMSNEPRLKMIKPWDLEPVKWKVNQRRWSKPRVKPTSTMLLENMHTSSGRMCSRGWGVSRGRGRHTMMHNLGKGDWAAMLEGWAGWS